MKELLLLAILSLYFSLASAQTQEQGMPRPPGEGVIGKVTAVAKDSITVAPSKGGDAIVIKLGDNTRVFKDRQPIKLSEIKVDDMVFARGQLSGNTLQAMMVGVMNPEMVQRMQQGGPGFGFGRDVAGKFNPEDWGKTFIAGRVKAINETTLTIARPDNQQTLNIEVDENTSFKRGRESITLADIKADDFLFGQGEIKNGIFVARELRVGGGRMFMMQSGDSPDQKKPDNDRPTTPKN